MPEGPLGLLSYLQGDFAKAGEHFIRAGKGYDRDQHQLVCDLGTLAAGDSWSVEIHMNAKGKLGTIRNTATVSSTTLDGNTGNNTATKDVIVGGGTSGGGGPKPGRGRP